VLHPATAGWFRCRGNSAVAKVDDEPRAHRESRAPVASSPHRPRRRRPPQTPRARSCRSRATRAARPSRLAAVAAPARCRGSPPNGQSPTTSETRAGARDARAQWWVSLTRVQPHSRAATIGRTVARREMGVMIQRWAEAIKAWIEDYFELARRLRNRWWQLSSSGGGLRVGSTPRESASPHRYRT